MKEFNIINKIFYDYIFYINFLLQYLLKYYSGLISSVF